MHIAFLPVALVVTHYVAGAGYLHHFNRLLVEPAHRFNIVRMVHIGCPNRWTPEFVFDRGVQGDVVGTQWQGGRVTVEGRNMGELVGKIRLEFTTPRGCTKRWSRRERKAHRSTTRRMSPVNTAAAIKPQRRIELIEIMDNASRRHALISIDRFVEQTHHGTVSVKH